jgi:hypothetical protein
LKIKCNVNFRTIPTTTRHGGWGFGYQWFLSFLEIAVESLDATYETYDLSAIVNNSFSALDCLQHTKLLALLETNEEPLMTLWDIPK